MTMHKDGKCVICKRENLVPESLQEFLNEANMEMFYVVLVNPEEEGFKNYAIVNKDGKIMWEGSEDDALTFLLRNVGISSTFEGRNLLRKADKFGGKSIETGNAIHRKGHFGNLSKEIEGTNTKIHGQPIMMQPFMINKEIDKGKHKNVASLEKETGKFVPVDRRTPEQVSKKYARETPVRKQIDLEPEIIVKSEPKNIEKIKNIEEFPIPKQTHGKSKDRREEIEKQVKKRRSRI